MGIRYLNKFLKENCPDSIRCINMADLSGKRIAVDISIYLYKYEADDTLLESIYLMLSIFQHYNVIPIFIFDGKPPIEKRELLQKRKEDKAQAQDEYNKLKDKLSSNLDNDDAQDIINTMDQLKKQFIHISRDKIESVKDLIRAWGCTYYDAPCEADELCAMLVTKKKVWACMSEDMDMFVYGCTRVLRYLSLLNHTVVLYDTKEILDNLGISQKELREICVLSGTDYNYISDNNSKNAPTLYKTLSYFKKYHNEKSDIDFYSWLLQKRDYIKDYDMLIKIYDMFDLNKNNNSKLKNFENIKIGNGPILKDEIKLIIQKEGFIFPLNRI